MPTLHISCGSSSALGRVRRSSGFAGRLDSLLAHGHSTSPPLIQRWPLPKGYHGSDPGTNPASSPNNTSGFRPNIVVDGALSEQVFKPMIGLHTDICADGEQLLPVRLQRVACYSSTDIGMAFRFILNPSMIANTDFRIRSLCRSRDSISRANFTSSAMSYAARRLPRNRTLSRTAPSLLSKIKSSKENDTFTMPMTPDEYDRQQKQHGDASEQQKWHNKTHLEGLVFEKFRQPSEGVERSSEKISCLRKELLELCQTIYRKLEGEMQRTNALYKKRGWSDYYASSILKIISEKLAQSRLQSIDLRWEIRQLMKTRSAYTKKLYKATAKFVKSSAGMKRPGGSHHRLQTLLQHVTRDSQVIEKELQPQKLRLAEMEMIRNGRWHPVLWSGGEVTEKHAKDLHARGINVFERVDRTKDKIASLFLKISALSQKFAPYEVLNTSVDEGEDEDEDDDYELRDPSTLAKYGHLCRRMELARKQQQLLPEIMFPKYWAAYENTTLEIWTDEVRATHNFSKHERDVISLVHLPRLRAARSNVRHLDDSISAELGEQIQFAEKLSSLLVTTMALGKHSKDIAITWSSLVRSGLTSICPNSFKSLHEWQCKTFGQFDEFMAQHLRFLDDSIFCYMELVKAKRDADSMGSLQSARLRQALIDFLRKSSKTQKIWRRETLATGAEMFAWSSAQQLASGSLTTRTSLTTSTPSVIDADLGNKSQSSQKYTGEQWRRPWLDNRSFYPQSQGIFVDYVTSENLMYLVIPELRQEKVLGLSVTMCPKYNVLDCILLANEKQILILDIKSISFSSHESAIRLLKTILENENILKVGIECKAIAQLLWDSRHVINLNGYISVPEASMAARMPHEYSNLKHDGFITGGYQFTRGGKRPDLQNYFHSLARQPYAALRAFHEMNEHDIVKTLPIGSVINISQARRDLDHDTSMIHPDITIGPIYIDHAREAESKQEVTLQNVLDHAIRRLSTRNSWLKQMSRQLARQHGPPRMSEEARNAFAAYYLKTMFNEKLPTISACLEMSHVSETAAWILWAAEKEGLPLHEDHRQLLKQQSAGEVIWKPSVP